LAWIILSALKDVCNRPVNRIMKYREALRIERRRQ
jgi:hypothetical protein